MNILIVEDDVLHRNMLTRMVRGLGHDTTSVETGRAALRKAVAINFDLFLLDVFLPDMTAMDLIPRLRAFQPDTKVITITGQSTRELELELRELGIIYYMAKPVKPSEMKSILDHILRYQSKQNPFHTFPPIVAL